MEIKRNCCWLGEEGWMGSESLGGEGRRGVGYGGKSGEDGRIGRKIGAAEDGIDSGEERTYMRSSEGGGTGRVRQGR